MNRFCGKFFSFVILIGAITVPVAMGNDEPQVVFRVSVYSAQVTEANPVLVSLFLKNVGHSDIFLPFPPEEGHQLGTHTTLMLTDEMGRVRTVKYERKGAPPLPCGVARFFPLKPGDEVVGDYVVALAFLRKNEERLYVTEIAPPGRYTAQFQLRLAGGVQLSSAKFELNVVKPEGEEAKARDRIGLFHLAFLEGRDAAPEESYYHGGTWWRKVDVSRFQEIQKILDDFPNSSYAKWIRFWKLYHHGPIDDALEYARNNRDFPLCDNLMLHMAEGLFNRAGKYDRSAYDRVRKLVAELLRDFPNGDTRAKALDLRQKLTKKP